MADDLPVDLYWLPLGAGASFVGFNGRVYEALVAARDRRSPLDLYPCTLQVHTPQGRFAIELTPVPDGDGAARGVVAEGTVGSRRLARFRLFRFELRCWRGGAIPDIDLLPAAGSERATREDGPCPVGGTRPGLGRRRQDRSTWPNFS